jgi:tetratricopeptide (TPR) repeat protein
MEDAVSANPMGESAETLFNQALDHHDREEFDEAIRCYQQAIDIDPNLVVAHNNLGMVFIDKGQFDDAVNALVRTITLDANYAEAYNNLGFAYRRLGNDPKAAACYDKFLSMEPEVEDGSKIKAWLEQVRTDSGGLPPILDAPPPASKPAPAAPAPPALPAVPAAPGKAGPPRAEMLTMDLMSMPAAPGAAPGVPAAPQGPTAEELCERGIAEFEREDLAGAEATLRKAVEANGLLAVGHSALGRVLAKAGRFEEAAIELTQAVSLDPADAAAYYVLGFTYRSLERDSDAADAYERYLELTPDAAEGLQIREWIGEVRTAQDMSPQALYRRALTLYRAGSMDDALEVCEQLVMMDETFADPGMLLGQILIQKGDYIRAVPALKRAERIKGVSPEVHFCLGQAYEKRGMPDDAQAAFSKYLQLSPQGANAEYARQAAELAAAPAQGAAGPRCQYCFRGFGDDQLQTHEGKMICPDCLANLYAAVAPATAGPGLQPSVVERATAEAAASRERKESLAKMARYGGMGAGVLAVVVILFLVVLRIGFMASVLEKTGIHAALRGMGLEGLLSALGISLTYTPDPDPLVDGGKGDGGQKLPDDGTTPDDPGNQQKPLVLKLPGTVIGVAPMAPFRMTVGLEGAEGKASYALVSGPEGLSVDAATGLISWDPQEIKEPAERYNVELSVEVPDGRKTTSMFTLAMQYEMTVGQVLDLGVEPGDEVRIISGAFGGDRDGDGLAVAWGRYRKGSLRLIRPSGENGQMKADEAMDLGGMTSAIAADDFTGDGRPDLALANWFTSRLTVLGQGKDGTFKKVMSIKSPRGVDDLAVGDVDLDGKTDIVASSWTEAVLSVYLQKAGGDGEPQLSGPIAYSTNKASGWNRAFIGPLKGGVRAVYLLCGSGEAAPFKMFKVMEEGRLDFYTTPESGSLLFESRPVETKLLRGGKEGLHIISLIGGRKPGICIVKAQDDDLEAAARPEIDLPEYPLAMSLADMNGDGRDDLIVLYPEEIHVYLCGGKLYGPYRKATVVSVPLAVGPMACGEFTGDSKMDLAVMLDDGKLQIVRYKGPEEAVQP